LPVIAWANGGCLRYNGAWRPLLDRWAAAGFFVVSLAGNQDGSLAPGATTAADQSAAIDWIARQNQLTGGPYEGRLDLNRVAAAGNSCGGITSVGAGGADSRVKTVFVLSGSGSFPGAPLDQVKTVMNAIKVPIAYVTGGPEDISRVNIEHDYDALPVGVPAYVARRATGDHQTVSTTPDILINEVANIGINWFDLAFDGSKPALAALTPNPCATCTAGLWTAQEKNLDTLVRASGKSKSTKRSPRKASG